MLMPPPETTKTRATSVLVILLVFLAGAAAGAAGMRVQMHHDGRHLPPWERGGKPIVMEKWRHDLNLNDEQVAKIENILDDFSKYYDGILGLGRQRVLDVLNDEQKKKFEVMLRNAKN